jgi:4'-phosphopantetheinyl transferase
MAVQPRNASFDQTARIRVWDDERNTGPVGRSNDAVALGRRRRGVVSPLRRRREMPRHSIQRPKPQAPAERNPKRPYDDSGLLARDDVAVWWLATDAASPADLRRWLEMLDQDERARAERFHVEADRRDFIAAHALLRAMLTFHWGSPPASWRFSIDAGGKPGINPRMKSPNIEFNLSHTRGLVAAAVGSHGAIGVDVEKIEDAKADLAVAEAYFAPAEVELLKRAPAPDRPLFFFRLWTLKEAYVKAIGAGLAAPLDSFAFTFEPIDIDFRAGESGSALEWRFAVVPTTDQHVLSVAVGRPPGAATRLQPRALTPQNL